MCFVHLPLYQRSFLKRSNYVCSYNVFCLSWRYVGTEIIMTYAYVRFSTLKQEDVQQMHTIEEYCKQHHLTIDAIERDEGVSGGVSFRDRNLNKLVKKLQEGDILIVSELSRLGRSMHDINNLINEELKPRKVRLVAIKTNVDIDCSCITAIHEMILFALSFAAQMEKELIQTRTQSAIDARKDSIKQDGGFFSKKGNWVTKLGRPKGCDISAAYMKAARVQADKAAEWRDKSPLIKRIKRDLGRNMSRKDIIEDCRELYEADPIGYGSRDGKPLTDALLCKYLKFIQLPQL